VNPNFAERGGCEKLPTNPTAHEVMYSSQRFHHNTYSKTLHCIAIVVETNTGTPNGRWSKVIQCQFNIDTGWLAPAAVLSALIHPVWKSDLGKSVNLANDLNSEQAKEHNGNDLDVLNFLSAQEFKSQESSETVC
jgi:hypothetical protein